jgi:hypothetical protein
MGERAPEIIDMVGFPDSANVVKDCACIGAKVVVGEQRNSGHVDLPSKAAA